MNFILEYNMSNNHIKVINFKNRNTQLDNPINIEESDNNFVKFQGKNNNNSVDFFNNNNVVEIEETVALKNEEKIYKDDTVYIQELVNQFLSAYPVQKQNDKYIIEKVEQRAKECVDLKNIGLLKNKLLKSNVEYQQKFDYINSDFNNKWVIPVVFDNHLVFSNIIEDQKPLNNENNFNSTEILTQLKEDPNGYTELEQKELLENLKKNEDSFEKGEINIFKFQQMKAKLYQDYQIKYNLNGSIQNTGYIIKSKSPFEVLRYNNIQSEQWKTRKTQNNLNTILDTFDENGKINGTKEEILVKGEDVNVFGFLVLKEGGSNILSDYKNILERDNFNNHLYHVLYNETKISSIKQGSGQKILINIENHGLENDSIIYIHQSGCYPKIDGYYGYQKKFNIINKNQIELNINKKLIFEGETGSLYILSKIKYDYYNVNDNLSFDFMYSNYDNKVEDKHHNKLYLFQNVQNIDKEKYIELLQKIVPSLDEIIDLEIDNLKTCKVIEDVNNILSKYNLCFQDLHQKQFQVIYDILLKNNKNINIEFNNKNKNKDDNTIIHTFFEELDFLKNNNYYLNNDYLLNKEVKKYYGSYSYLNLSFDCIIQRYDWLFKKKDYGNYFYLILSLIYQEFVKNKLKYISNKVSELNKEVSSIEKSFIEEKKSTSKCSYYKYEGYLINEKELKKEELKSYFSKELNKDNEIIFLFENKLYYFDGKMFELNNEIKNNKLLLIKNSYPKDKKHEKELYKYEKNKWVLTNELSKYDKLKYLCEFKNIDLEKLSLDDLDCIYRKDYGCQSKTYVRLSTKLEQLNINLEMFKTLESQLKSNKRIKDIEQQIKDHIQKFDFKPIDEKRNNTKIKNKKNNVNISSSHSILPIDILVSKIRKLNNILTSDDYFYQLIDKDCLLIDKDLYLKKYKHKFSFCGHYYYKKKIFYSSNDDERNKYIQIMIGRFSDAGESEGDQHICNNCGETLLNSDYDEVEGHAQSGAYIISRETWVVDESFELDKMNLDTYLEKSTSLECNDDKFKELLIKSGLHLESLQLSMDICNYISKTLYPKLDIQLPNGDFINVILDSLQKINLIIPFKQYKINKINSYLKKGISQKKIQMMDEKGLFNVQYKKYYEIEKQCIICARLFISIQTIIPYLKSTKRIVQFDEIQGLQFFAELLKDLNAKLLVNTENVLSMYRISLKKIYDEFKSYLYIKQAFTEKKKYLHSLKRDLIISKKVENEERIHFNEEPEKINVDKMFQEMKTINNINKFYQLYNSVKNRELWNIQKIKDIIQNIIEKKSMNSIDLIGGLERSCCAQDISTYTDFYEYFQIIDEEQNIMKYINEANELNNLIQLKLNSGCYHRKVVFSKDWFCGVHNPIIVYDGIHASEKLKMSLFLQYVDEGFYKGTPRDYIQEMNTKKDIKSGKTIEEIKNNDYTIEEMNELLKAIELNNMRLIKKNEYTPLFDIETKKELKTKALNGIYIQQNILIQNIKNILNKNSDYEEKYKFMFSHFESLDLDNKSENKSTKEKLQINNEIYNKKLEYFKKVYLKLSRYISTIQNNFEFDKDKKLNVIVNSTKRNEMKILINEENSKLDKFLEPSIIEDFRKIKLSYSVQEINSILGRNNIYSVNQNKILKYSDFTNENAYQVVMYILFEQMNKLFQSKKNESEQIVLALKNKYNIIIAQFLDIILKEFQEDYELFNTCNRFNEFEHLDAQFYNAYQLTIMTSDESMQMKDYLKQRSENIGISNDKQYIDSDVEQQSYDKRKSVIDSIDENNPLYKKIQEEYGQIDENTDLSTLEEIQEKMKEELGEDEPENIIEYEGDDVIDAGSEYGSLSKFEFDN